MADNPKAVRPRPLFPDHRRDGKTLVPPMVDRGWHALEFADTMLPELIWIGFLQHRWGARVGAQLAVNVIKVALERHTSEFKLEFGFITAHRALLQAERTAVRERLEKDGALPAIQEGLRSFLRCYPENNPLAYLADTSPSDFTPDDIDCAKRVVGPRISRWSAEGTAMQAVIVLGELATHRLHLPADGGPPMNFDAIFDTPDDPAAKESGGYLRASMSNAYAFHQPHLDPAWWTYFWRRGYSLEPIPDVLDLPPPAGAGAHVLLRFGVEFARIAIGKLREVAVPIIRAAKAEEEHAVVNGLLARQVTLGCAVAITCESWNTATGPLYLRALADCHITLAWILGDLSKRARDYVLAGLGQEKLQIAHQERALENMTDPTERKDYQTLIELSRRWVECQKFLFWIPVNTGAWSGKSTRQMAEEAGCLDFYNHVYVPFSSVTHSMWNYVGKMNSIPHASPLHQNVRIPFVPLGVDDPSVAFNAAKYVEKSFAKVIECFGLTVSSPSLQVLAGETLEKAWAEMQCEQPA